MSNFDEAHAELDQAEADYNALVAKYAAATLDDAADDAKIADLTAELVASKAEIAALKAHDATHHTTEPPPATDLKLIIGCNKGTIPGCPSSTQLVRMYAGAPFQAVSAGLGTDSNWGDHVLKRSIAITFNDENLTGLENRIFTFLNSVPKLQMQGDMRLYVTDVHEPERGDKNNDPAACRAWTKASALAIRKWRTEVSPLCTNVWANPNYMGWYERDAITANTTTRDWWPWDLDLTDVVIGVDPYDPNANKEIDYLTEPTLELWRLDGGKRHMYNEINTKRTSTNGRDWWNRTFANIDADKCEAASLFLHESAGQNAPWRIDAMSAAEFDRQIKARS